MEQFDLLVYLIDVLNRMNLDYFIAGSIATSYYGEPRFTNDIDVIVILNESDISDFCQAFPADQFYLSAEAVKSAIKEKRQFNILHPSSGLKVDIFVFDESAFEQSRLSRRQQLKLDEGTLAWLARPEDVILKKLVYYKEGESEKHIRDILGVLKIQGNSLNQSYLEDWATQLGLLDLWRDVLVRAKTDTVNDENKS